MNHNRADALDSSYRARQFQRAHRSCKQ